MTVSSAAKILLKTRDRQSEGSAKEKEKEKEKGERQERKVSVLTRAQLRHLNINPPNPKNCLWGQISDARL